MLKLAMIHYKVIIVIIGVCTGYAYYDTRDATPSYESEATVEIDQKIALGLQSVSDSDMRDSDILYTQVEKATSTAVMRKAIMISEWLQEYYEVDMENEESILDAAQSIQGYVGAKLKTDTLLIDISVRTKKKDLTYYICKAVSEGFSQFNKDENTEGMRAMIDGIQKQYNTTKTDLEAATKAFHEFSSVMSLTSLESQTAELDNQIRMAQSEQSSYETQLAKLERDLKRITDHGFKPGGDLQENFTTISNKFEQFRQIPSIYENTDFVSRLAELEDKQKIVKDLSVALKPAHPAMDRALTDVNLYRENVILTVAEIPKYINRNIAITEDQIEERKKSIKRFGEELKSLRATSIEYNVLKGDMDNLAEYLGVIRDRKNGLEVDIQNQPSNISILEFASTPSPKYPNTNQTILFGLLAGIGLSYGFLYLLNMMDQSIKSVEQAEQVLQLPVLAAVPAAEPDGAEIKNRLIMRGSSNSTCSEAFRSLRVNIESMNRSKSNKVVLFTSSMPSEGKTFTSINYAASLAQQGHKTLLIDMDLRKPAVAKDFDIEKSNYVGLTELITSEEKLEQFPDLSMYEPAEGLSVLHGGPLIDNPAERLSSYAVERIIEKAREHYDRVVIDSAPLGPVGDTLTVARLADMVCLVVRSAKTPSKIILRIIDTLHRHGHTPAGIVLNFMKIKSGYGSYYYYYSSDKEPEITSASTTPKKPPYKRKSNASAESENAPTNLAQGDLEDSTHKKKQIPSEYESNVNLENKYVRRKKPVESHPSV